VSLRQCACKIIQVTVTLHNFIIKNEEKLTGNKLYLHITPDNARTSDGIRNISFCRSRGNKNAVAVREVYLTYFQGTGSFILPMGKSVAKRFLIYLF